jgi:hypothetical protein
VAEVGAYLKCLEQLKSARMNNDSWWQGVADLTLPKRDFTTTREPGTRRKARIYDSTGVYCTTMLASGLHGNLTPSTGRWWFFNAPDRVDDAGKEWLEEASELMWRNFSSPDSLFASSSYELYLDVVAFGQGVMLPAWVNGRVVYKSRELRKSWIRQNDEGVIDTLYYVDDYRPVDIIRMFPDTAHRVVRDAYEKGTDVKFPVLHAVQPRDEHYGKGAVATAKPWSSVYVDINNKHEMAESGFDSFPYLVPRFSKRSGETYGYGPGMDAIQEVQTANEYSEVMFRAAAKNVDPPVLAPVEGLVLPMRLDPNGINYYDPELGEPKFWNNGFRPDYLAGMLQDKQQLIKQLYYIDWLNVPNNDRMTAEEFRGRQQESMRIMGPTNSRLEVEFLSRLIERTLELYIQNNALPPLPASLRDEDIALEYTSPLAQAQRAASANSVLNGIGIAAQLAGVDPTVVANINVNAIFREQVEDNFNWPVSYLNALEDVEAAQAAAKQQQQVASGAETAETYSKAVKNGAGAVSEIAGV